MVIYDTEDMTCELYEIKHSRERVPQQYRHLVDPEKCRRIELAYGDIVSRTVLYRGDDCSGGDIRQEVVYRNVEHYLEML